jgi:hypothetical protein
MYKLFVFCPDNPKIINKIINTASDAGAGIMGNYSHCATVLKGVSQWKSGKSAHPTIGKIGTISRVREVKIEMVCPEEKAKKVKTAIKKVHPYEEPAIEFIKLEDII